jgi:uncharacterized protein
MGAARVPLPTPRGHVTQARRMSTPVVTSPRVPHWWTYPLVLIAVWATWATAMTLTGHWSLYEPHWPMAVTMVFGSFVAGSTPAGGGAVAYPVFTKLLGIPSSDAALFGLMIQAVGMSMASLFIVTRNIRYDAGVVRAILVGALPGVVLGLVALRLPSHVPRLGFSCLLSVFGIVLLRSRWRGDRAARPPRIQLELERADKLRFALTGLAGGLVASAMGSGADMLGFIVMVLAYDLDERVAVPTSVIVMACVSVIGFGVRLLLPSPIGVVWEYWAVAAPIVALGAPLGAWVASKVDAWVILAVVFVLISAEVGSTLWIIPLDGERIAWLAAGVIVIAVWLGRLQRVQAA